MSRKKKRAASTTSRDRFEAQATEPEAGLIAEFWAFFRANKKWWMIPIVLALLVLAGFILLAGTALAPFIYPLF